MKGGKVMNLMDGSSCSNMLWDYEDYLFGGVFNFFGRHMMNVQNTKDLEILCETIKLHKINLFNERMSIINQSLNLVGKIQDTQNRKECYKIMFPEDAEDNWDERYEQWQNNANDEA